MTNPLTFLTELIGPVQQCKISLILYISSTKRPKLLYIKIISQSILSHTYGSLFWITVLVGDLSPLGRHLPHLQFYQACDNETNCLFEFYLLSTVGI